MKKWLINFLISIGRPPVVLFKKIIKLRIGWKYPTLVIIILTITIVLWCFYDQIIKDLPNINEIYNPPKLSTRIYDRQGQLLYKFHDDENRIWVPFEQIPENLVTATIAVEDKEFYQHHGFSLKGMVKAAIYNFKNNGEKKLRGGSTITQQLVKNVFLTNEKSVTRKIKEMLLSIMLELKLSKEEILERYFNQVPYGGNVYGAAEASWRYFGKKLEEINLAEAAFLAGLPAAPGSYSPFTAEGLRLAKIRQEHVLDEMVSNGSISQKEAEVSKKVVIKIKEDKKDIKAAHFVFYVKNYLEKLGFSDVNRKGLEVKTSLDLETQQELEKIVKEEVDKTQRLRISNGAGVIIDVNNGDILALMGSKDYFAKDIDGKFDLVTQGLRQPGSAIKPINYLLALQRGRNLWELIDDSPVTYYVPGQKPYSPQNYTGKYLGRVTLRTALASSLNVPSVKLLDENGVDNMINLAKKMGITTWEERSRFGLSLALGAGEVKMIELAQAYSTFATLGEKIRLNPILEVKNYLGEVVYQKKTEKEKIFGEREAFLINEALSDNQARSPIFGSNSLLNIKGKKVAVKTGTTNNLKDNWCIGWTPEILVATWVGNNDSSPMSWVASGISGATPIWNRAMRMMIDERENKVWEVPEGLVLKDACGKKEWLDENKELRIHCPGPLSPTPPPV